MRAKRLRNEQRADGEILIMPERNALALIVGGSKFIRRGHEENSN
jgi:hypothetical protein